MIKSSTISKAKIKENIIKQLPAENIRVEIELQKACLLIKEANIMIAQYQKTMDEKDKELKKIKSHWLYRFINRFK